MPKIIHLCSPKDRDGILVKYIPSGMVLDFRGWYDGSVGIEGRKLGLGEFLSELGITGKDCEKAISDYIVKNGE